ncbi:hypothetical protein RHMOL_Rhmol08G0152000 [Rhododendron molle]|uniref:Uncharacterized protein n=1 Tax=Rhododendron molle TaxID=49168 RepID=A0ACC0MP00_RHOML|nr:hypothetical protein RHMOL_Rhmol08G0152000 [Rhododendron molle]
MSHTLLGSFWTPACKLVSGAGAGGTSLSELLRGWLFIYFRNSCKLYSLFWNKRQIVVFLISWCLRFRVVTIGLNNETPQIIRILDHDWMFLVGLIVLVLSFEQRQKTSVDKIIQMSDVGIGLSSPL